MRREYERVMSLKNLARTGWMQRGVPPAVGETVAQHSFEASILALILASRLSSRGVAVDVHRAAVLALVHDLGEAVLGDVPRWTTLRLMGDKERLELEAAKSLAGPLGIGDVVVEAVNSGTLESRVAKLAELLATALQAKRYVGAGFRGVEEIYVTSLEAVRGMLGDEPLSLLRELVEELLGEQL